MILGMLATSCNTPTIQPITFCLTSFKFKTCSCADYNIDVSDGVDKAMERLTEFREFPLEHCELSFGPSVDDWSEQVVPYGKEWARFIEDRKR